MGFARNLARNTQHYWNCTSYPLFGVTIFYSCALFDQLETNRRPKSRYEISCRSSPEHFATPITRQIQALECELGTTLLVRIAKGVELTDSGRVFFEEAQRTLKQSTYAVDRTRAADRGEVGILHVAYFGTVVERIWGSSRAKLPFAKPSVQDRGSDRCHSVCTLR